MSNIIIVGNGPSLLDTQSGEVIDSYDIVVRFNAFVTKGYEEHVGTKTDYWFNTINFQDKYGEARIQNKYKKIYLHSWQWDPEKDLLYKTFVAHYQEINNPTELIKTTRTTIEELQEFTQDKDYFSYSTGAMAIWMLSKEFEMITITGFDWWNSDKHHYSDKAPRGNMHKPDKELKFINRLIEAGKVKIL